MNKLLKFFVERERESDRELIEVIPHYIVGQYNVIPFHYSSVESMRPDGSE
mgnify:CR=1 FL=1